MNRCTRALVRGSAGAILFGFALVFVTYLWLPPLNFDRFTQRSPTISDRDGILLNVMLSRDHAYRLLSRPQDVDHKYIDALISFEDRYFWIHPGVNPLALLRAAVQWVTEGQLVSGGSTITMQVARLLEPKARTLWSKWIEIVRAFEIEARFSKQEILTMYLTMLPMGGNVESVRAASLRYWGVEPTYLSLSEIALLLAVPQSPEKRRPDRHPQACLSAIQSVANKLVQANLYKQDDLDEVKRLPFNALNAFPKSAWQMSQSVVRQARANGETNPDLKTTLSATLQRDIERRARQFASRLSDKNNVAVMVADAKSGAVLAHLGSLGPRSEAGYMDLTRASRSPGSTLKPFIYGMGFDDRLIDDQTILHDRPQSFDGYAPSNFDHHYQGPVRAGVALQQSLNMPAVEVLQMLGADTFSSSWKAAGLNFQLPDGANANLGFALGAVGVNLWGLVTAYTALANNGRVNPLTVRPGSDAPKSKLLLTPATAGLLTEILASAAVIDGRMQRQMTGQQPAAFKTGTSYGYRDSWAIGVKGRYVVGVWVGRPDGTPVVGRTGRDVALRLATDIADDLKSVSHVSEWVPEPIDGKAVDRAGFQVIAPRNGAQMMVTTLPSPTRTVMMKSSGVRKDVELRLNDRQIFLDGNTDIALHVPDDGFYRLEVRQPSAKTQVIEFGVLSAR